MDVDVNEFAAKAAELLASVEATAREVVIVRDGEPIAFLRAANNSTMRSAVPIRWGKEGSLPDFEPIKAPGTPLSELVIQDREDRF